jgi:hypothetical protein
MPPFHKRSQAVPDLGSKDPGAFQIEEDRKIRITFEMINWDF